MSIKRTYLFFLCSCALTVSLSAIAQNQEKSQKLQEVVVIGNNPQSDNLLQSQMGAKTLSREKISNIPTIFGEPDVLRAVQSEAGVSGGIEGFSGILVRGGNQDENLFLLHHLPLYNVSHLGGLFSSFNVAAIDQATFLKSGFPARYGGRVSSVTDVRLREGDYSELHGQASIGLMAGNLFVTGPLVEDRLAVSASVRRSWLELISIPALALINRSKRLEGRKSIGRYALLDANLKLDYRLTDNLSGYTHLYYGNDYLKLGDEKFELPGEDPYNEKNIMRLRWGNTGAATGLAYRPNDGVYFGLDAYYVHFSSQYRHDSDEYGRAQAMSLCKTRKNGIEDGGATLHGDFTFAESSTARLGADYVHHRYHPETLTLESSWQNGSLFPLEAPTEEADELAVWTDNTLTAAEWLQINAGLRWICWKQGGRVLSMLEPRLSLRLSLTDDVSLKGSYMRTHQFVQQVSNNYVSLATDPWLPLQPQWDPLESDQLSAGLYATVADGCYFSVEGYYKWMLNLLEYKDDFTATSLDTPWPDKLTAGKGWAYGVDISLNKDEGQLTGSISYGLMWNYRQFNELNDGQQFPAKFDNRHKVNITGCYHLSETVTLNFGWTYMTGNRVTVALQNYQKLYDAGFDTDIAPTSIGEGDKWGISHYARRNNVRLPDYHRLDVGVSVKQEYDNDMTGIWSFGLYNAYCRMNPISITKDGILLNYGKEGAWNTKFRTLGLLPVIPSISYTLTF